MKEFIEKLIGRLEELQKLNYEAYETAQWNNDKIMYINASNAYANAITEVNQLAEEYKHCTLCHLQSPCEYQNENAILPNELLADKNGWIACSERLPKEREYYLVSDGQSTFIAEYADYKWTYHCSDTDETYDCSKEVIAWQPLPSKYEPKGE